MPLRSLLALVVLAALAMLTPPASAATLTVTTVSDQVDANPGDGACATASGL